MIDGNRLKQLREKKGFTIDDLAHETGITRQQIARYEKQQTNIGSENLILLALFLDVTTDYLIGVYDDSSRGFGQ